VIFQFINSFQPIRVKSYDNVTEPSLQFFCGLKHGMNKLTVRKKVKRLEAIQELASRSAALDL